MANEKQMNSRLQMKHDVEDNWIIAGNATKPFIPKQGEIIIYDIDSTYNYERMKIGDGITNVNYLPFIGGNDNNIPTEGTKIFIGTQKEYEIAYAGNGIPVGSLVIILEETLNAITTYYSSLSDALSGINGNESKDTNSVVSLKIADNKKTMSLLSDMEITETVNIEEDLTFNLAGYNVTSTITPVIRAQAENVNLIANDGSITVNAPAAQKGTILSVMSGTLNVDGGTYTANTAGAGSSSNQTQCVYVATDAILNIKGATITSIDTNNGSANGVTGKDNSTIIMEDCTIFVKSGESMENRGVSSTSNITLKNCDIRAVADYTANAAGNGYASNSRGVWCNGHLIMEDCYVDGSHAGVTAQGSLYINGGSYNGYGHGGIYLAATSSPNYCYNAEFNWAPMQEGSIADTVAGTNGAGFYIGGSSSVSNQSIYFDNCHFNMVDANGETYKDQVLPFYGIVMRTSGGEKNNTVYISNSDVKAATTQMFRGPGTSGMKVYNGIGNDWSAATKVHGTNSTYFIDTTDSYEEVVA